MEARITGLRRELHEFPELGFEETRTSERIAEELQATGLRVRTGVGGTGVVGYLGEGRPSVGIRADMDALPIHEENTAPYASKVPGVMHACGHDAHVAMAIAAAQLLAGMSDRPDGEVRLLFQPAEERVDEEGRSGAVRMVADGAVEGLDAIIALHITSDVAAGTFEIAEGYATAMVDNYIATIIGEGCHDAYPQTGLDTIFLLAQVINAIHGIRSVRVNPMHPTILSVSTVHGGDAANVIPGEVVISGTIRSYQEETQQILIAELERAVGLAQALGGDYRLSVDRQSQATYNDPEIVRTVTRVVEDMFGIESLATPEPGMAGEDFGFLIREIPGIWFMLGAKIEGEKRPHHSPVFDLDESVFPMGAAVLAETACRILQHSLSHNKELESKSQ